MRVDQSGRDTCVASECRMHCIVRQDLHIQESCHLTLHVGVKIGDLHHHLLQIHKQSLACSSACAYIQPYHCSVTHRWDLIICILDCQQIRGEMGDEAQQTAEVQHPVQNQWS